MLDDLDRGVDRTDSKLSDAMRKMRKFVRETEGQSSMLCLDVTVLNMNQRPSRDGVSSF
jgi:hypothetical protein